MMPKLKRHYVRAKSALMLMFCTMVLTLQHSKQIAYILVNKLHEKYLIRVWSMRLNVVWMTRRDDYGVFC